MKSLQFISTSCGDGVFNLGALALYPLPSTALHFFSSLFPPQPFKARLCVDSSIKHQAIFISPFRDSRLHLKTVIINTNPSRIYASVLQCQRGFSTNLTRQHSSSAFAVYIFNRWLPSGLLTCRHDATVLKLPAKLTFADCDRQLSVVQIGLDYHFLLKLKLKLLPLEYHPAVVVCSVSVPRNRESGRVPPEVAPCQITSQRSAVNHINLFLWC